MGDLLDGYPVWGHPIRSAGDEISDPGVTSALRGEEEQPCPLHLVPRSISADETTRDRVVLRPVVLTAEQAAQQQQQQQQ